MDSRAVVLLNTRRLTLRPFTAVDVDNLYDLDNDPAVMRYINGGIHTPRERIEREILPGFMRYQPGSSFGVWAAEGRDDGQFVGWFSLRLSIHSPHEAILGYRLRRAAWGRGLATEGARALLARGLSNPGLQRVLATTYEENRPSRRVLEKLGLRLVRRFRLTSEDLASADTFHTDENDLWDGDDLEYALLRTEWEKQQLNRGSGVS